MEGLKVRVSPLAALESRVEVEGVHEQGGDEEPAHVLVQNLRVLFDEPLNNQGGSTANELDVFFQQLGRNIGLIVNVVVDDAADLAGKVLLGVVELVVVEERYFFEQVKGESGQVLLKDEVEDLLIGRSQGALEVLQDFQLKGKGGAGGVDEGNVELFVLEVVVVGEGHGTYHGIHVTRYIAHT